MVEQKATVDEVEEETEEEVAPEEAAPEEVADVGAETEEPELE